MVTERKERLKKQIDRLPQHLVSCRISHREKRKRNLGPYGKHAEKKFMARHLSVEFLLKNFCSNFKDAQK